MGIWQKRLGSWVKINSTQVSAHLGHPVHTRNTSHRLQFSRARLVRPRQELHGVDPGADAHQGRSQMPAQRTIEQWKRGGRRPSRVPRRSSGAREGAEAQDGDGAILGEQEEEITVFGMVPCEGNNPHHANDSPVGGRIESLAPDHHATQFTAVEVDHCGCVILREIVSRVRFRFRSFFLFLTSKLELIISGKRKFWTK